MFRFMRTKLFIFATIALFLAGCAPSGTPVGTSPTPKPGTGNEKIVVVATYSILGDLVANVGGDQITMTTLVGAGGDAHTFQPTPNDAITLGKAAVIFENGLGFEPWLDELYDASHSKARRAVVSEGIKAHTSTEDDHANESESEHGDEHGEFDPHIWHDVKNVMRMVEIIRDILSETDASNAAVYQKNAENYLAQLSELDDWVQKEVAKLPKERRKLVTSHDTFGYFAERYGFEVIGSALASVSTEITDPAAAKIAALVDEIKASGVHAIFAENISNPTLMENIAAEANVTLVPTLYTDALGKPGGEGDTYLKMIRFNVEAIVKALEK